MSEKYSRLDKGILYATGALFLDVMVGQAFTGRPLHESLGIEFSDLAQRVGQATLAAGMCYSLFKPYYMSQRKTEE